MCIFLTACWNESPPNPTQSLSSREMERRINRRGSARRLACMNIARRECWLFHFSFHYLAHQELRMAAPVNMVTLNQSCLVFSPMKQSIHLYRPCSMQKTKHHWKAALEYQVRPPWSWLLNTKIVNSLAWCYAFNFLHSSPLSFPFRYDPWPWSSWLSKVRFMVKIISRNALLRLPHQYSTSMWEVTISRHSVAWYALSHNAVSCAVLPKFFSLILTKPFNFNSPSSNINHSCTLPYFPITYPCYLSLLIGNPWFALMKSQRMRHYFISLLAFAFSVAAASPPSLSDILNCAVGSVVSSIGGSNCGLTDYKCICNNKGWLASLLPQIEKECSPEDLKSTSPSLHFSWLLLLWILPSLFLLFSSSYALKDKFYVLFITRRCRNRWFRFETLRRWKSNSHFHRHSFCDQQSQPPDIVDQHRRPSTIHVHVHQLSRHLWYAEARNRRPVGHVGLCIRYAVWR